MKTSIIGIMENAKLTAPQKKHLAKAVLKQMIVLSTSGFGVVAALAWNSVIQDLVTSYIKPHLPAGSGIISLIIYAVIVTVLAVVITTQLTQLVEEESDSH